MLLFLLLCCCCFCCSLADVAAVVVAAAADVAVDAVSFIRFYLQRNDTEFGEYTVFTGVENISSVNLVDKFNGLPELNHWASDYANQIVGTGEVYLIDDIFIY